MLNGWKTIITAAVSLVISMAGGAEIDMTPLQHSLMNAFFAASYMAIIVFKLMSTTTFGKNVEAKVEAATGVTHQQIVDLLAPLLAQMPATNATLPALVDAVAKLHTSVEGVKTLVTAPGGSTTTSVTDQVGDISRTESVTVAHPAPAAPTASAADLRPRDAGLVADGSIVFTRP